MSGERIPKLERLLNLTALLLETRRPLTVDEIGNKMLGYPDDPASFRRQFERDKDELRSAGVPLEAAPIDGTDLSEFGYRILPERYYLPDPGFAEDERAAIRVALGSIHLDDISGAAAGALSKLGIERGPGASPIASLSAPEPVLVLRAAIAEGRVVRFVFNDAQREVEPHRITYVNGRWYLTGFDRVRDDVRNFRIERIDGSISVGDPGEFEAPAAIEGLHVEPWRYGVDEPTEVTLRIDAGHVSMVRPNVGDDARWIDLADGAAEVTCVVRNWRSFRSFVLSLLDHGEIVSPPEFRDWFVASLGEGAA